TFASLLENASINRCSRYLNAYAAFPAPSESRGDHLKTSDAWRREKVSVWLHAVPRSAKRRPSL
ncbi:hypothetical protein, partial [Bradyrhizobium sp. SZCCHNS3004]|uniref:hypothetical protein n=1 Tax=Bradyrhizobium sp. SZCCHNS3004 TaxID=3057312 RepID=UPI0029165997